MSSNQNKHLRLAIVLLPLLIFLTSLTQDGFSYQYIEVEMQKSYLLLLVGGMAFIGGGLFETLI